MSREDRERWDARHARAPAAPAPLDPFVGAALERLGPGAGRAALDLAAGSGRHALELARRGWRVEAWDVSPVGLARLAERAAAAALDVVTREVDLAAAGPPLDARPVDLVVLANYLERPLLPRLAELVRPGGHLVFATFTVERPGDGPPLEYCLRVGELAAGVPGFRTLEAREEGGRAGLLAARIPVGPASRSR